MSPNACPKCGGEWIVYLVNGPLIEDFGYYVKCEDWVVPPKSIEKKIRLLKPGMKEE